jgi:hypothetical protein
MAILGWGAHQHRVHLALITRFAFREILECSKSGELYLASAGDRGVLCGCVGPCLEMALSAESYQEDSHRDYVSDHDDWIYGKQCLSRPRR